METATGWITSDNTAANKTISFFLGGTDGHGGANILVPILATAGGVTGAEMIRGAFDDTTYQRAEQAAPQGAGMGE